MGEKLFSFRFDIDSLADIEVGVPNLIDLARELDVRFTFFVNMGKSFNWRTILRSQKGTVPDLRATQSEVIDSGLFPARMPHSAIRTIRRLGLMRTVRTVILNPNIGLSHTKILSRLLDDGHELGLHGGMDHPTWQWELSSLSKVEINELLKPAYDYFVRLFGKPKGFASPGFRYNQHVLELIDDYGFEYATDMEGERPFRPEGFRHLQLPVNVVGPERLPLLECLSKSELRGRDVIIKCEEEIYKRDLAVIYGHPSVEGTIASQELFNRIKDKGYGIVPMKDIIESNVITEVQRYSF